ncbi:MAG: hypothetical protein CM1200mP6_00710 [Anaerolineaceae bacterium]|nr:MAG: hypothetical protein CM1200mP6_00710 [Anaerolineaceae bacterium]
MDIRIVAFKWIDRVLIDGALHSVANLTMKIGSIAVWFEKWGIDYAPDKFGDGVRFSGHSFGSYRVDVCRII